MKVHFPYMFLFGGAGKGYLILLSGKKKKKKSKKKTKKKKKKQQNICVYTYSDVEQTLRFVVSATSCRNGNGRSCRGGEYLPVYSKTDP